ncbi:sodium-dependent transporter [Alteromonas sp. a30]|uniref:sodium-dependent transporter n=1 Tax=Alteromonas sp. a30 TaxID=2730917 RepID=UPI002281C76D|nr:sodium-dependent transporter [Alteromonas sp. a30]MCY7293911.1 sodium-dependent transporter [Alteromonas sp. a30]
MNNRGEFSSRLGFILAAAGSAVGLGNIWGFPTQVASNGGAAFVVVYLILAFVLAYPVLMAELVIGRATRSNTADAFEKITGKKWSRGVGFWGFVTVSLILSFYAIVAGWMISYCLKALTDIAGLTDISQWLSAFSDSRNSIFSAIFIVLTAGIVVGGVSNGIEKWSVRLMPTLFVIIAILIVYVATLDGAQAGLEAYLSPDFSAVFSTELLISAMGQAFFSMSLGVGTMLVYASYVNDKENLPVLGASVALVDIGVAILAGLLIIPAMYVALHNGVEIFNESGGLINGDQLILTVLPALFETMGSIGNIIALAFFALMVIASLTSSISMLEVPVSYVVEDTSLSRPKAVWLIAGIIMAISITIALNFDALFVLVVSITTEYSQPILGLILCVFVGWLWNRNSKLQELKKGYEDIESSLFWKIWPTYVKFVCPIVILLMFVRSVLNP